MCYMHIQCILLLFFKNNDTNIIYVNTVVTLP